MVANTQVSRTSPFAQSQSGMSGSSPHMAEPARFARAEPALFATENEELITALSVER